MFDIIEKKRDGQALSEPEIHFFVHEYTNGNIPDEQMSALLMAIYFQGMTEDEQAILTKEMVHSGEIIDLSKIKGTKVDKHSTGGVGDTTTIILAPLVASLDIPVAKMSGRGLGHTGGTLDKLEAIPGFKVELPNKEFTQLVNQNKVAVISQSGNLTPADQKIYSLRDITATVNSIPLIASSIMSKKIAAGADAIVLDVKTGSGAFMKELKEAKKLAEAMVAIGQQNQKETMAVITDMNQPLGNAIGNALEIKEAIDTLKGDGPKDLTELCLALGSHMVALGSKKYTKEEAYERLKENLTNGKALEKFQVMIQAQRGDVNILTDPSLLPEATYKIDLVSEHEGYVETISAQEIGRAASILGAGRVTQETEIDLAVGIVLHKKIGQFVQKGETYATIHTNQRNTHDVQKRVEKSISFSPKPVKEPPLIYETIF